MGRPRTGAACLPTDTPLLRPEGHAIAFASMALDQVRKAAVIRCSCSLAEAEGKGAMHFMVHNLIRRYKDEYETFDLWGADNRSLSEFKQKFANRLVPRFSLEKSRGPISQALINAFAWTSAVLKGS
jgi:hypothetical protein